VHRICQRHGKWLSEWYELDPTIQEMHISAELDRVKRISEIKENLTRTKIDDDGEESQSIDSTVYALIRMLGDLG